MNNTTLGTTDLHKLLCEKYLSNPINNETRIIKLINDLNVMYKKINYLKQSINKNSYIERKFFTHTIKILKMDFYSRLKSIRLNDNKNRAKIKFLTGHIIKDTFHKLEWGNYEKKG